MRFDHRLVADNGGGQIRLHAPPSSSIAEFHWLGANSRRRLPGRSGTQGARVSAGVIDVYFGGTVANLSAVEYTVLLDRGTSLTADASHRKARASSLSRDVVSAAVPAQAADNNTAYLGDGSRLSK